MLSGYGSERVLENLPVFAGVEVDVCSEREGGDFSYCFGHNEGLCWFMKRMRERCSERLYLNVVVRAECPQGC